MGRGGRATTKRSQTAGTHSLKHGLLSRNLIIPGENAADFEALLEQLLAARSGGSLTELPYGVHDHFRQPMPGSPVVFSINNGP